MPDILKITTDDAGIVTVRFDQPGRSVNTFTPEAVEELDRFVASIDRGERDAAGVIFTSAKPDGFITGADLFEMSRMNPDQMRRFLERGQSAFERLEKLKVPTVAAINGHCLGGGLEMALACRWRVAADIGSINIGLPESKLGIIPGWGGTTRVTRRLGPPKSLPMLLAGATMPPRRALRAGLIDEVVRPEALLHAAKRLVGRKRRRQHPPMLHRLAASTPWLGDKLVWDNARKKTHAKTYGNYPAADQLIDTARTAWKRGHKAGLDAERAAVMHLVETEACRNLMRLFFLRHQAKRAAREGLEEAPMPVHHAAVIGGGVMGAGIVAELVKAAIPVRLVEIDANAISAALRRIRRALDDDMKAKRLSPLEARRAMHRVSPAVGFSADTSGLKVADLIVEAVSEKPEIKRDVFTKLNLVTRPDAVLATNTSSLSVTDLAGATANPARVIGLHFFNPVSKMPLVEVVRTERSGDRALATGVELALRIGKTPIMVGDAPGFLVNRLVIPYLAEALAMAAEGAPIGPVDTAMKRWGMPMGPFELLDQVGLDVAASILHAMRGRLGERLARVEGIDRIVERGQLGRKTGMGFYDYRRANRRPPVNTQLVEALGGSAAATKANESDNAAAENIDEQHTQWRLILPMINEAAGALTEGVTDSEETIDLATVLGLGLAPFRGGLARFAETAGLREVVRRMDQMTKQHGDRFAPLPELRRVGEAGLSLQSLATPAKPRAEEPTSQHA